MSETQSAIGRSAWRRRNATLTWTGALATIAICLLSSLAAADEVKPVSGAYDALLLAVDPASGAISGYVRADTIGTGTGAAPQFTCRFAFAGTAGEQKIVAWWPGGDQIVDGATKIGGVISFKADSLTVTLQDRPGGCQYLMGEDNRFEQDLSARHDWRAVRVIRSARAYFYDAPDEKTRRKAFAVENDGVGVLRIEQDWAEVEFVGDERTTRGWMKIGDFYTDAPPESDGSAMWAGMELRVPLWRNSFAPTPRRRTSSPIGKRVIWRRRFASIPEVMIRRWSI